MRSVRNLRVVAILILAGILVCLIQAQNALAQNAPGNITVFADANADLCSITDQAPGPITVYVMHTNFSEMVYLDFRVSESSGFLATYLGETVEPPGRVGDFRNGISLSYGVCKDGPQLLGTISYQGQGTSQPCSYLEVVAWRFPSPATEDCNFIDYQAPPLGRLYVNPQPGECQPWCTVATESSTWGNVKALYRN